MRAALDDESTDAVALIEPAMDHLKGLPPTMVRVVLGEDGASIASIGKQLAPSLHAGGIEAGLYAWHATTRAQTRAKLSPIDARPSRAMETRERPLDFTLKSRKS